MRLLTLLFSLISLAASAQSGTEEATVKTTINQLFTGMIKADSTLLTPIFTPTARLQTIVNKQGDVTVNDSPFSAFITNVGKAKPGVLDERLSGMTIHVEGDLATAWTPYVFYRQGQKDHCGVNAFTLVRISGSWKIQGVIDTRRKENCPDIPAR